MHYLTIGFQHSSLEPFLNQPQQLPIANPPAQHLHQIEMIQMIEEPLDVGFNHEVVLSELELDRQFIDRVECTFIRPVSITTAQEILLVDGFQYPRDR